MVRGLSASGRERARVGRAGEQLGDCRGLALARDLSSTSHHRGLVAFGVSHDSIVREFEREAPALTGHLATLCSCGGRRRCAGFPSFGGRDNGCPSKVTVLDRHRPMQPNGKRTDRPRGAAATDARPHAVVDFILERMPLCPVPAVPEISLHTAHPSSGLWQLLSWTGTGDELAPPYWAYPWAGGTVPVGRCTRTPGA